MTNATKTTVTAFGVEVHPTYNMVRFVFSDATVLRFGRCSRGRWLASQGDGWQHVHELITQGYVDTVHHGPETFGHTDYVLRPSLVSHLALDGIAS